MENTLQLTAGHMDALARQLDSLGQSVQGTQNSTPGVTQNQPYQSQNGNRGGFRGRGRGRGNRGRGTSDGGLQCYFCKGKVPYEQARHRMTECALFRQVRDQVFPVTG